jgi:hypothetical protein
LNVIDAAQAVAYATLLYDIGAGTASRTQLGDLAAIAVATDVVVFPRTCELLPA